MLLLSQVSILLTTPIVRIVFAFKIVILVFVVVLFLEEEVEGLGLGELVNDFEVMVMVQDMR